MAARPRFLGIIYAAALLGVGAGNKNGTGHDDGATTATTTARRSRTTTSEGATTVASETRRSRTTTGSEVATTVTTKTRRSRTTASEGATTASTTARRSRTTGSEVATTVTTKTRRSRTTASEGATTASTTARRSRTTASTVSTIYDEPVAFGEKAYYYGISITQTRNGAPWSGPPCPTSVMKALALWEKTLNGDGSSFVTTFGHKIVMRRRLPPDTPDERDFPDDQADPQQVQKIYSWYASTDSVDLLFCPSLLHLLDHAIEAAKTADAIWICWAFEEDLYFELYEGHTVPLGALRAAYSSFISRENGYNVFMNLRFNGLVPHLPQEDEPIPPGNIATAFKKVKYGFNINLGDVARWTSSLATFRQNGVTTVLIIYSLEFAVQADEVAKTAVEMNFYDVKMMSVATFSPDHYSEMARYIGTLGVNLTFLMTNALDSNRILLTLETEDITVASLVLDAKPSNLLDSLSGVVLLDLFVNTMWAPPTSGEDRSTDVFGSFRRFNESYLKQYDDSEVDFFFPKWRNAASQEWRNVLFGKKVSLPPLPAIQIATAGEIFISALMNAQNDTTESVGDAIRSGSFQTLMGIASFDHNGARLTSLPQSNTNSVVQFGTFADVEKSSNKLDMSIHATSSESLEYRQKRSWNDKRVVLSPCSRGCSFEVYQCTPCPPGTYSSHLLASCVPCDAGKFAYEKGSQMCMQCPTGSECAEPSHPMPKMGWYRELVIVTTQDLLSAKEDFCLDEFRTLTSFIFLKCIGQQCNFSNSRNCTGDNKGFLCNDCEQGSDYSAFAPGTKICSKCSSEALAIIQPLIVVGIFLFEVLVFFKLASDAAVDRRTGSCALFRVLVTNSQMVQCVMCSTSLDNVAIGSYLTVFFGVLYRPIDFMRYHCIRHLFGWHKGGREDDVWQMAVLSMLLLPFAILGTLVVWSVFSTTEMLWTWHVRRLLEPPKGEESDVDERSPPSGATGSEERQETSAIEDDPPEAELTRQQGAEEEFGSSSGGTSCSSSSSSSVKDGKGLGMLRQPVKVFATVLGKVGKVAAERGADEEPWKTNSASAKRFLEQNDTHHFFRRILTFMNMYVIFALVLYAPILRGAMLPWVCVKYTGNKASLEAITNQTTSTMIPGEHIRRLEAISEISCDDLNPRAVVEKRIWQFMFALVAISVPCSLWILLRKNRSSLSSILVRRMVSPLVAGYKPNFYYWEIVRMVRMMSLHLACCLEDVELRCGVTLVVCVMYLVAQLAADPFTHFNRNSLVNLEHFGNFNVTLVVMAWYLRVLLLMETDEVNVAGYKIDVAVLLMLPALIWTYFCILYMIFSMFLSELLLDLHLFDTVGWKLNSLASQLLRLGRFVYGLTEVRIIDDGQHVLFDLSNVTKVERKIFKAGMERLVEAAVVAEYELYPTMLVHGAREGFEKALNTRIVRLSWRNQMFGEGEKPVKVFPGLENWRVFGSVHQVPFDLNPIDGSTIRTATADEIAAAFEDVAISIERRFPTVKHRMYDTPKVEKEEETEREVVNWTENEESGLILSKLIDGGVCTHGGPVTEYCPMFSHVFNEQDMTSPWQCQYCKIKKTDKSHYCDECGIMLCRRCLRRQRRMQKRMHLSNQWFEEYKQEGEKDDYVRIHALSMEQAQQEMDAVKREIADLMETIRSSAHPSKVTKLDGGANTRRALEAEYLALVKADEEAEEEESRLQTDPLELMGKERDSRLQTGPLKLMDKERSFS
eukprot:TRINITY_DN10704_c0_g1_i3.p1 TRINITY_DN10704_c0_g1~~TRINITY_DN10704_c0_g1_i3.p1  ORF type:complete len:1725 (+),score=216.38 TRINITY_DN10704_c0_g1_i3:33-5177(+)